MFLSSVNNPSDLGNFIRGKCNRTHINLEILRMQSILSTKSLNFQAELNK